MKEIRVLSESERTWAMFCHLSAFACFIFPFGNILGPLICWLSRRDDSTWVNENGKASLNFQLSLLLYTLLLIPLCFILVGIPLLIALWILNIVCVTIASIKASRGEEFRYPLAIPFIQ
ncbi:MAG TPA: DUF4870 domain-containing protein [Bacteroidales bacterium]|nr:DUF4870 domain-containing protein [Bacteroidales bacterium]HOK73724.1 DUF4870 domain-containing protein [Bacteroidales bacterium]HOM39433.1 DUF4870 domain-containing protein [Bacteroidales bacterium]HOU30174.1 DUF4870 domain-containing protein [Bacteroidales bacterium]HPP91542.1 DUF4870 domain-containing protein [Bacteroidales bacterium]